MFFSVTRWLVVAVATSHFGLAALAADLYTQGHGDLRASYENGTLALRYQLDGNAVVGGQLVDPVEESTPASYELSDLVLVVPDPPLEFPAELIELQPELGLLGVPLGGNLWYLPETQEPDRPWFGFSTEELDPADWSEPVAGIAGLLRLDLIDVAGPPGAFVSMLYNVDLGNPTVIHFATFDGIDTQDSYQAGFEVPAFPAGAHSHVNWMFTQPGIYDVTVRFSGRHAAEGYREAIGTLRFAVAMPVPEPPSLSLAIVAVALLGAIAQAPRAARRGA